MDTFQSFEKKFHILQEISGVITTTKDITTLANLILDRAIEYTGAEKGSVMLNNEYDELCILAARGFDMPFVESYKVRVGEDVAGVVAKIRSAVLVEDIETDPRFKRLKRKRYKTKSFISCPMISGERLLGVININDKRGGFPFTQEELNVLKVIADQAAIAFENAFLIRQLRIKAADLEEINRKLIEIDINKTEFLTRISHELRSPLNSIKGAVYYLLQTDKLKRDKAEEFYNIILNEIHGLVQIVEDLITFLRLEDEKLIIKKSVINLPELLGELSHSQVFNTTLAEKNIHIHFDIKKPLRDIIGDKIKIMHMLINLVEGLIFYLQRGDSLTFTAREEELIHMTITASRKLDEDVLVNLTKSAYFFYRERSFDEMRLYLAKKAVEAHGWTFRVTNCDESFVVDIAVPKSEQDTLDSALTLTMNLFADFISELLGIDICSIMLRDELTADLVIKGAKGLSDEVVRRTRINVGDQISGWVAASGKPLLIEDIEQDLHLNRKNIPQYSTKSLLSLPLKSREGVIGVLNLNNKKSAEIFTKADLYIALIMSERIAHFVDGLRAGRHKEAAIQESLAALSQLIDTVKKYYKKERILPDLVMRIMEKLGTDEEETKKALYVSIIYDLGLMRVDENVLAKRELSNIEKDTIKKHPHSTINLLNTIEFAEDVKKAVLHHHERYDGTGYPAGLKGNQIPLVSRVIAVVDSYRAMISERSYGRQYTHEEALLDIREKSGTWYDPEIVGAFEGIFHTDTPQDGS